MYVDSIWNITQGRNKKLTGKFQTQPPPPPPPLPPPHIICTALHQRRKRMEVYRCRLTRSILTPPHTYRRENRTHTTSPCVSSLCEMNKHRSRPFACLESTPLARRKKKKRKRSGRHLKGLIITQAAVVVRELFRD